MKINVRKLEHSARPWKETINSLYGKMAEKAPSPDCNGMKACLNRKYDKTKSDCKECMDDYDEAMNILNETFWELV